jgi:predicted secreted protein with PEFG-CTERM motif
LARYGTALSVRKNLASKTKYVTVDNFTTAAGAICAAIILLGTFVFISAFAEETRYVAMFDEPCMMEGDEYGQLKLCYIPYKVTIPAGSVVMWENVGDQVHTVTSGTLIQPTAHFNSGLIAPDSFYSLEFAVEGIYPYYCMMHPWMNGQIVVGEKITPEEKEIIIDDDLIVILEDGQFQNATGVYWANGTAVVPEFPIAVIVLLISVTAIILLGKQKLTLSQW